MQATMNEIDVGIIGVGNMGGAMARRLLDMGVKVTACDRNTALLCALAEEGAIAAPSPKDVADHCRIVIGCLPSPEASTDVALGARGVVHGTAIEVYVETSTIGRAAIELIAQNLQEQGIGCIDCPI